jgi:hypothetical protein
MLFVNGRRRDPNVAGQQTIDWSFFSVARYVLTADSADDSVIHGSTWDGLLERLRQVTRLQRS